MIVCVGGRESSQYFVATNDESFAVGFTQEDEEPTLFCTWCACGELMDQIAALKAELEVVKAEVGRTGD